MVFVTVALLCFLCYGYWNTFRPILRKVDLEILHVNDKNEGLRILHLSDMHMERISVSTKKMHEAIADTDPNIVILTGDYLDHIDNLSKLEQYLQIITNLKPKYGIYAVLGNHDYRLPEQGVQQLIRLLESYQCHVLINQAVTFEHQGQKIQIVGIDDYHTKKSQLDTAFACTDKEQFTIVMTHDPNVILEMTDDHRFDYLLAGHFHGGQCNLPFVFRLKPMGTLPKQKMYKGLLEYQGKQIYISEGIGQSALNIRFNSKPEITLHHLI